MATIASVKSAVTEPTVIARDAANEKYGVLRKPVRPIDYRDEPEPSNHAIENLMDDEPDDRLMDFENEHGDFY